jgi:hypothetical protein
VNDYDPRVATNLHHLERAVLQHAKVQQRIADALEDANLIAIHYGETTAHPRLENNCGQTVCPVCRPKETA